MLSRLRWGIELLNPVRVPRDDQEAKQWTEKTIIIEASDRPPVAIRENLIPRVFCRCFQEGKGAHHQRRLLFN